MMESSSNKDCMTVVVPVYNRPKLIVRCLESLKAQTYRPITVLVVDNASEDSTPEVVREWVDNNRRDDFQVELLCDSRRGAAYARQTGLDHTVTSRVMFFDSDDTMRPECVETVMETWNEEPLAQIVAWPVAVHRDGKVKVTHSISGNLLERHMVHAVLRTQGYAVKTHFIRMVGGWRGQYPNWNDLETGVRLLLFNPEVLAVKTPLVDVFPQKESITGTSYWDKVGLWEMALDAIERSILDSRRDDMVRLLNIVEYRRAVLAADYWKEGRKEEADALMSLVKYNDDIITSYLLRFAYRWTRAGLRGAFRIIGPLL